MFWADIAATIAIFILSRSTGWIMSQPRQQPSPF